MKYVRVPIFNFTAGLNRVLGKAEHPVGGLWNVKNFHPYMHGLEPRRGYALASDISPSQDQVLDISASIYNTTSILTSQYNTNPAISLYAPFGSAATIFGSHVRRPVTNEAEVLIVLGNSLLSVKFDGGIWTTTNIGILFAAQPSADVQFVDFGNDTFIFSAGLSPMKYDGTSISEVGGTPPKAGAAAGFEGFILTGDLNPDPFTGEVYRNGLRWSARFNPEQWDDNQFITAGLKIPSQCPSEIRAIAPSRDEAIVLHRSEVESQRFIGGEEIFRTRVISVEVGVLGPRTWLSTLDFVVWLGNENIYLYAAETLLTLDLERRVRDNIFSLSPAVLSSTRFYYDKTRGDVWMVIKSDPPQGHVYNLHTKNWTYHEYSSAFFNIFPFQFISTYPIDFKPYFIGIDAKIYDFSTENTDDDGTAIEAEAEFITDFNSAEEKILKSIILICDGVGDVTIGVDGFNNPNATPVYQEKTLTISTVPDYKPEIDFTDIEGIYMAFKISTSDNIKIRRIIPIFHLSGVGYSA